MVQDLMGAIFWGFHSMPLLPELGSPPSVRAINMSLLPELAGPQLHPASAPAHRRARLTGPNIFGRAGSVESGARRCLAQ